MARIYLQTQRILRKKALCFAELMGRVSGLMEGLQGHAKTQTMIEMMVSEAVKTSEIEGEYISRRDVISSIRNNLGLAIPKELVSDKRAQGAAELILEKVRGATTKSRLQVISDPIGNETVHFVAPPSKQVPQEMAIFMKWFNDTAPGGKNEIDKPPVRSALAHLYFESIHPFEDGNGRIGRAISEKALSQGVGRPILLSLSVTIEARRNDYYEALNAAQHTNDATDWIDFFVQTCLEAQTQAEKKISFTLKKTRLMDRYESRMNARQLEVVRRMLEEGPNGFEGGMSAPLMLGLSNRPTYQAALYRDS